MDRIKRIRKKLGLRCKQKRKFKVTTDSKHHLPITPNLLERNKRRIASLLETGKVKKREPDYRPAPGTMLTREYQGREYRVIATADAC